MDKQLSRRYAVKLGVGALGTATFGPTLSRAHAAAEPHFFLHVVMAGGVDPTYWFDARPLDMTDAGLLTNTLYKRTADGSDMERGKRLDFEGKNGTKCLRTTLTEPLMKFKDELTVINGVVMNGRGIEGHGQNMYTLFTGQNVGGFPSFIPMIGQSQTNPIESVHIGDWKGDGNGPPSNFGASVQIESFGGAELFKDIARAKPFDGEMKAAKYLMSRYEARAALTDAFSLGCKTLHAGLRDATRLGDAIKDASETPTDSQNNGALLSATMMAHRLFIGGVTGSVTIMMDRDMGSSFDIDAHDSSIVQDLPENYAAIIKDLVAMIDYLKATEFSPGKSLLDVTTVMISSEFGRTYLGFGGGAPWATGTEHNQLINSLMFIGKGIKPGQLIGSSDLETVDEFKMENRSKAHGQAASSSGVEMPMGKPFDFATGLSRTDKPEVFKITDYLTVHCVLNTFLKQFGFQDDKLFRDPDGRQYPTIEKWLLKTT